MRSRYVIAVPVVVSVVALAALHAVHPPSAGATAGAVGQVFELPGLSPDATTFVRAMSPSGQLIVGESNEPLGIAPVYWVNGTPFALPLPPNSSSAEPRAINNRGIIVGADFDTATNRWRALRWDGNQSVTVLAPDARQGTLATDINDRDEIVGFTTDDRGNGRAVRFVNGRAESLFSGQGRAEAITNRTDRTVGNRVAGFGEFPFEVSATGGTPRRLPGLPGGDFAIPVDMSAGGSVIVGTASVAGGEHPVVWRRPSGSSRYRIRDLTPGDAGVVTEAAAVSPSGRFVVGDYDINGTVNGPGEQSAFIWSSDGGLRMLPEPVATGCRFYASAVTDSGVVAGNGCVTDQFRFTGIVWQAG